MGCIFSHTNPASDSYVYETDMPDFSKVREPPVSRNKSVMSSSYFQKYVKRDKGHDVAYTEILK